MEEVPYGRILREGWILIVVLALVGAAGAWVLTRVLPPTYSASTTLMLQVESADSSLFERNQFSLARIKSYPVLVDSPEVIDGVRADLEIDPQEYSDRELRRMLSAQITEDTVLLQIRADAPTAILARDLANSAAMHQSALIGEMENSGGSTRYEVELEQVLPANEPSYPDSPQVTAITGLGFIAGLAAGFIVAVYRTTTNRRLLTISDVRRATGLPVVGQIPKVRRTGGELAPATLVSLQELIANLPALGGHDRALYVLVPASSTVLDNDMLAGLLEAYSSKGFRACALDLRGTQGELTGTRSWLELLEPHDSDPSAAEPSTVETSVESPIGAVFTAERVVSGDDLRARIPAAVRALRAKSDVVVVVCDSKNSTLQAKLADLGAGFVVAVRHRSTSATEVVSAVTRMTVMDLRPFGVLMVQTPRGAHENLAESWRWTDGEVSADEDLSRFASPISSHGHDARSGGVEAHGRRALS